MRRVNNIHWDSHYAQRSALLQQFANVVMSPDSHRFPTIHELNAALSPSIVNAQGMRIHFIEQAALTQNYEQSIYESGFVATRDDNWHDYFNAHVWLNFPKTKAVINALQYQSLVNRQQRGQRSALENALTLFDENGVVILCANPQLSQLLRSHQWYELFYEQRDQVLAQMRVVIVGHSMHEKALTPYIGMTAHGYIIEQNHPFDLSLSQIDAILSEHLQQAAGTLSTKSLQPLPVLGYPDWHFQQQTPEFYGNQHYFRTKNR